jgi:CPA2 family monovalent cation:H+ antiporter-2
LFWTSGKVVLLALVTFGIGPLLVPPLLGFVARAQSRELFTLAVLVLALGIAFCASEVFGVSIALGAFFAGMIVGQSDLSHQAAADALPLRDAFAVLFFVAVGMLFDPVFVVDRPLLVLAALALVLVAKPAVALAMLLWRGHALPTSLAVAAGIAQVSEFAFVLAGNALSLGVLPPLARDVVLSAVLLSITASPLLFKGIGPIERWLQRRGRVAAWLERRGAGVADLPPGEELRDHAVLVGHGRVGGVLGAFLQQRGIPFVVVDRDRALVEDLRRRGVRAVYGDGGSPTLLDHLGIARARVLLVTTPDAVTARLAVEHGHRSNRALEVVARVHHETVREFLHRFQRTHGVHGELELAYAMARLMLTKFGVSAMEAEATVIDARRAAGVRPEPRTRIVEIHVPDGSKAVGRRIADLGMPRGALVVTIGRGGEFVVPGGQTELCGADVLLVLAEPEAARAIEAIVAP